MRLFFEQNEALACLPFLIGEFSRGRIQEMMVVGDGGRLLVQGIVGCCPEEVG